MIDGCTDYGAFLRVAVPLVKPGIVATSILSFIFSWNNFLFSVILAGRNTRTLPIAVFNMIGYEEINWGPLAAAANHKQTRSHQTQRTQHIRTSLAWSPPRRQQRVHQDRNDQQQPHDNQV